MKRLLVVMFVVLLVMSSIFTTSFAAKKITIAGMVFQEDQFMKIVLIGMKAAADKYGVNLLTANTSNQITKETELINTYISRGVDAIIIDPLSKTASVSALKAAQAKGIKILDYDSQIEGDFILSFVGCSQYGLGESTGKVARQFILTHFKDKKAIKVATIAFRSQLPEMSDARVNGFLDQIKDIPGVTVVAQQDAWLDEMSLAKTGDVITANPDLDIIFAANDGGTHGSVLAVKKAGKAGQIFVFGTDADIQMVNFLQSSDNILQAVTGQQPYFYGYTTVELAVKAVKGQKIEKNVLVPGQLLQRSDPAGVQKFADFLKKIM